MFSVFGQCQKQNGILETNQTKKVKETALVFIV